MQQINAKLKKVAEDSKLGPKQKYLLNLEFNLRKVYKLSKGS